MLSTALRVWPNRLSNVADADGLIMGTIVPYLGTALKMNVAYVRLLRIGERIRGRLGVYRVPRRPSASLNHIRQEKAAFAIVEQALSAAQNLKLSQNRITV